MWYRAIVVLSILAATLIAITPSDARAQTSVPPDPELDAAEAALESCSAAASAGLHAEAREGAAVAERSLRPRIARRPADVRALVGLARTLGQCRIPGADLMQMGELSAESIDLLKRALEIEPDHWLARYVLALNYYRAPSFLGRGGDAAREFDRLILQQGERSDVAEFARPFEYRGMLWLRAGQRDSAMAVWQRGARLFPGDAGLRARLGLDAENRTGSTLDTIRVVATGAGRSPRSTLSERVVTRSEILTSAGGMADILQTVQLQPGATRITEGADLFTRGGDPAETPTLVDGGRMPSLTRFEGLNGGLSGAIDPFAIRSARFSSGGFSVRHGNALSGVLEIETNGRPREMQWRAGLALSQAGAGARVPLARNQGVWGTVRGTHAGALLRTHRRTDEFVGSPHSIEAMAAYIVEPRPGHEVRVLGMAVRDASARLVDAHGYTGPFTARGETLGLIMSLQRYSARAPILMRGNLALSDRSTDWSFGVLAREHRERSGIGRWDLEYAPSDAITFRTGVELGHATRSASGSVPITASVAPGAPARPLAADTSTWSGGSYGEAEWRHGELSMRAGIRMDRLPGEQQLTADPRFSLSTRRGDWTARVSVGEFHQGRWRPEPVIPDAGTPAGIPRQARHLIVGVEREGNVALQLEAFLKGYDEYESVGSGAAIVDGAARGFDLVVRRSTGDRLTGWLGYSFLDSKVSLIDGSTARSPYDVTHTATGSGTLRVARATSLGVSMRYGTGRPFTPVLGGRTSAGHTEPVYGAPTSERLPHYARVDTRLMQYLPLGRSLLVGYLEVLNVFDRANVSGYVWDSAFRTRRPTHTFYAERTLVIGFELQSR